MILAADLGSRKFGWATFYTERFAYARNGWRRSLLQAGTWILWSEKDKRRDSHPGLRWDRLRQQLEQFNGFAIDKIVYEVVRRHDGTVSAQSWGGAQAILAGWASERSIPLFTVEVAEAKAAALGRGTGSKQEVTSAMDRLFPSVIFDGPDAADAAAIGLAHLQSIGLAPPTPRVPKLYSAKRWGDAPTHKLSARGKAQRQPCHFCKEPLIVGEYYARLGRSAAHYDCTPYQGADPDRWAGTGKLDE